MTLRGSVSIERELLEQWKSIPMLTQLVETYGGQAILRKYIRPKALELGIEKRFGWHTF